MANLVKVQCLMTILLHSLIYMQKTLYDSHFKTEGVLSLGIPVKFE